MSSDGGGALLVRELELRTGTLRRLAGCFRDKRDARLIEHSVEELLHQRIGALSMGYEDLNDHDSLRYDPAHGLMAGKTDIEGLTRSEGNPADNFSLNHPLRGRKTQAYEGGIRIPFCMSWPDVIAPNGKRDDPISSLDIFPTVLTAAGGTVEDAWQLDGINLTPYFHSNENIAERTLYWKERNHRALRQGDWKHIKRGTTTLEEVMRFAEIGSDESE